MPLKCVKTKKERFAATLNIWAQRLVWDKKVNPSNHVTIFDKELQKKIGEYINLDDSNLGSFFKNIFLLHPRWICSPISVIYKFAQLVEKNGIDYRISSLRFVELMGEYAEPEHRAFIEEVLNCKTINHFGTKETWCIAYECPFGNLHIQEKLIYLEILNKSRDEIFYDDCGEVIVTSFFNKAMPFVRYNLNDIGKINKIKCNCGKTSQVLDLKIGRSCDMIKGKTILGTNFFINNIFHRLINEGSDDVDNYKIVQTDYNEFDIFVVAGEHYSDIISKKIVKYTKEGLGNDVIVNIRLVESIERLPSGKSKIFECML